MLRCLNSIVYALHLPSHWVILPYYLSWINIYTRGLTDVVFLLPMQWLIFLSQHSPIFDLVFLLSGIFSFKTLSFYVGFCLWNASITIPKSSQISHLCLYLFRWKIAFMGYFSIPMLVHELLLFLVQYVFRSLNITKHLHLNFADLLFYR